MKTQAFAKFILQPILISFLFASLVQAAEIRAEFTPSDLLTGIHQDQNIVSKARELLANDPVMKSKTASGIELLAVSDSGVRYRCDCYDILVKLKHGGQVWIETVKIAGGKLSWLK